MRGGPVRAALVHMKEQHADIFDLDCCPKCSSDWTKRFKRARRTDAVVKDACSIGEHWGSAHNGWCPTCSKRNFVDGNAVYNHRLEDHMEETLLKICAPRDCQGAIVEQIKTPTGLGFCAKHKPKNRDLMEHIFFCRKSRRWDRFNVDIEQGMGVSKRYCTDFPEEFFSRQNVRLSFKQKTVISRHLKRFGMKPQDYARLNRRESQDLLISHFNRNWNTDPVRIEYNPVTAFALNSCWHNKWSKDKDGNSVNRGANITRWKHYKENWETVPTLIPPLVGKRRGLFTAARAPALPTDKIVKDLTVAFPAEGGSLTIKGMPGAPFCLWMECRENGKRAWISMIDGSSVVYEKPLGKVFVPEKLPAACEDEKVDLEFRGPERISIPLCSSKNNDENVSFTTYACTLKTSSDDAECCQVHGTKDEIAQHYEDFHHAKRHMVDKLLAKLSITVPSFDKPMIQALQIGHGHDGYPPLFLFKNYMQAGIPRHVFEAVRKSDFVLEKYYKDDIQAFKQHLSAAKGAKVVANIQKSTALCETKLLGR